MARRSDLTVSKAVRHNATDRPGVIASMPVKVNNDYMDGPVKVTWQGDGFASVVPVRAILF